MRIKVIYILINISGGDHILGSPLGGGINWRREKINETFTLRTSAISGKKHFRSIYPSCNL